MYQPAHFEDRRPEILAALMQAHPFATLITLITLITLNGGRLTDRFEAPRSQLGP